jgi:hypothetical protein
MRMHTSFRYLFVKGMSRGNGKYPRDPSSARTSESFCGFVPSSSTIHTCTGMLQSIVCKETGVRWAGV